MGHGGLFTLRKSTGNNIRGLQLPFNLSAEGGPLLFLPSTNRQKVYLIYKFNLDAPFKYKKQFVYCKLGASGEAKYGKMPLCVKNVSAASDELKHVLDFFGKVNVLEEKNAKTRGRKMFHNCFG